MSYKLPVTKQIHRGDVTYGTGNVVNTIVIPFHAEMVTTLIMVTTLS